MLCGTCFTYAHAKLSRVPRSAEEELDNFAHILEIEGVIVRRPEIRPGDFEKPVRTPDFTSKSQLYAAMPRDILIVVSAI